MYLVVAATASAMVLAIVIMTVFIVRDIQGNLKELARVEADLELASRIQSRLLDTAPSCGEGVDFASCYLPARQVGGDYLEFIPLGEGKWGIVVADVMGHGVSAALLMTMVRTAFRGMAGQDRRPRAVLETLNAALAPDLGKTGSMVCVSYATYDRGKHRLAFAQAGHHPPLHLDHATGEVRKLVSNVQPIGLNETNTFKEGETALAPGDVVVFFTDGLVQCRNGKGTRFGVERVERIIRENSHRGADELRQAIMDAVRRFTRTSPGDDLALAVIKVTG